MSVGLGICPDLAHFPNGPLVMSQLIRFDKQISLAHGAASTLSPWRAIVEDNGGDGWDLAKGINADRYATVTDGSTSGNDDTAHYGQLAPFWCGEKGSVLEYIAGFELADASGSAFACGLGVPSSYTASILDGSAYVVDGIFFLSDVSGAGIDFAFDESNGDTTYDQHYTDQGTLVNATRHEVAWRIRHDPVTAGDFEVWAWLDGELITHKFNSGGLPDDVGLGFMCAHRGGAGDTVKWSYMGAALYEPGEYV